MQCIVLLDDCAPWFLGMLGCKGLLLSDNMKWGWIRWCMYVVEIVCVIEWKLSGGK